MTALLNLIRTISIRWRLRVSFFGINVMQVCMAAIGIILAGYLYTDMIKMSDNAAKANEVQAILKGLNNGALELAHLTIANTEEDIKKQSVHVRTNMDQARAQLKKIAEESQFDAEEAALFQGLQPAIEQFMRESDVIINYAMRNQDTLAFDAILQMDDVLEKVNTSFSTFTSYETERATHMSGEASKIHDMMFYGMMSLTVIGFALAQITAYLVTRSITDAVGAVSNQLNELAQGDANLTVRIPTKGRDEVTDLSKNFNNFAQKINDILRTVRSSVDMVGASSQQIASTAQEIEGNIQHEQTALQQIVTAINEASSTVTDVSHMARSAASNVEVIAQEAAQADTVMQDLIENSSTITTVVKVIDDISEQTNLLALNAAIEAARAGDAGRGFAVVADEVRKLASNTSKSTKEINEVIAVLQSNIQRTQQALTKISGSIRGINEEVNKVSSATGQQSSTIEQISATVREFSAQMNNTSAAMVQTSAATNALATEAAKLSDEVSVFKLK
ncbi:MAG: HAMP domain-containing protein [Proteobacteria bacterium]|nr:HAMP domain-containing protein [Pseudomonadota bacterium]